MSTGIFTRHHHMNVTCHLRYCHHPEKDRRKSLMLVRFVDGNSEGPHRAHPTSHSAEGHSEEPLGHRPFTAPK